MMMNDSAHIDDIRRRLASATKAVREAGKVAESTPQWRAVQAAQSAFSVSPENKAHEEAMAAVEEIEEEAAKAGVNDWQTCEWCDCPLFSGKKMDEAIDAGGDMGTVPLCHAAAYEDDKRDCPGKRLGLLQQAAAS